MTIINDSKIWGSTSVPTGDEVVYLNAEDIGRYDTSGNAQVVVKLFSTIQLLRIMWMI